jgi:hypothetical protein
MKQNQQLSQQQIAWIKEHSWLFDGISRSIDKETMASLFGIYSWIDGKNHRPTGCGRCVMSAKARVWAQYKKQQNDDQ